MYARLDGAFVEAFGTRLVFRHAFRMSDKRVARHGFWSSTVFLPIWLQAGGYTAEPGSRPVCFGRPYRQRLKGMLSGHFRKRSRSLANGIAPDVSFTESRAAVFLVDIFFAGETSSRQALMDPGH